MLGTAANGFAILAGGLLGMALKRVLNKGIIESIFQVMGVVILITSIVGIISNMVGINQGALEVNHLMIVTACIIIGTLIGEAAKLESLVYKLGYRFERGSGACDFRRGFLSSCIFFGVGALQIIGPIAGFAQNDNSILITKSLIDFPFAVAFASMFGAGVLYAALPVAAMQIIIGLLSLRLYPFFTPHIIMQLSAVGYVILFCSGLNMTFDKLIEIKTLNLMPSVLVTFIVGVVMAMLGR